MAEIVFRDLAERRGLGAHVVSTSSGTGDWHVGEQADRRTIEALARRGYDGERHRARQFSLDDFTRNDLPAGEPPDPAPGGHSRNWSLINRINQKGLRPQDKPVPLSALRAEEKALIQRHYPELSASSSSKAEEAPQPDRP